MSARRFLRRGVVPTQLRSGYEEQIRVGYRMMMRKVMKAVGETFD